MPQHLTATPVSGSAARRTWPAPPFSSSDATTSTALPLLHQSDAIASPALKLWYLKVCLCLSYGSSLVLVCKVKTQLSFGSSLVLVCEVKTQLKTYDPTHGLHFNLRMLRVSITTLEFALVLMLAAMLCLQVRPLYIQMSGKCQAYLHVDGPFLITVVEHVCSEHM
jgi:hypothetical protein